MRVHMLDLELAQPPHQPRRFEPIGKVPNLSLNAWPAQPNGGSECLDGADRPREHERQRGNQKAGRASRENDLRSFDLRQVRLVFEVRLNGPDRKSVHVVARALDGFDLATNERVADRRIEVAEIG
jgi:hypothetical protein